MEMALKQLSIAMISSFRPNVAGHDVKLPTRKSCAVLACLALADDHEMSRDRLVGLLWSESDPDKARASLRQATHELRDVLETSGFDGLEADKHALRLRECDVTTDITDILAAASNGDAHPLILGRTSIVDDFLASLESVDPAFQAWVTGRRRNFEDSLTTRFETALGESHRSVLQRERLARALGSVDPTNEVGIRHLMAARFEQGDTSGALNAYKGLWDLLSEEYDTEPSRQTQDLLVQIKLAEEHDKAIPSNTGRVVEQEKISSRLVVPIIAQARAKLVISMAAFEMGGVPEAQHYMVYGFRRDLLSSLVRFREWSVREANGVVQGNVASDEYTIEASAFAQSNGIRLALMLRDNASGVYLWSERFQIASDQWLEVQQSIVRRLAAVLNVQVSSGRLVAAMDNASSDTTAYDQWLRGQSDVFSWNPVRRQIGFEAMKALAQDYPSFSPGFSTLAQMINSIQFVQIGHVRTPTEMAESIQYGLEAVRLDPVDSRGHLALGWAYAMAGQHERAAVHHDLAINLNDNDSWTLMSAAWGASCGLRHDVALSRVKLGLELSVAPTPIHLLYCAHIAFARGDYQTCVDVDSNVWHNLPSAKGWYVAALANLGQVEEAKIAFEDFAISARNGWVNGPPPDNDAIGLWFLKLFPFASDIPWTALRDGLARAGVDVSSARFGVLQEQTT
jgi:DNA-binding SARP family transcriptional activator/TolB-like protein